MKIDQMIVFNLATDDDDPLLAFTSDWVKAFDEITSVTEVFSTHVGTNSLPKSIKVHEIGGGTAFRKGLAIFKLFYHGLRIITTTRNTVIFHHMSTYTAVILGPLFKVRGFKQGLWYSHNRDSVILRVGSLMVNEIFTPTADSFPFKSNKLHSVGHGIRVSKFKYPEDHNLNKTGIVSLGRISEVKRLDKLITGLFESGVNGMSISLIGPTQNQNNLCESLVNLGTRYGISINFLPLISHRKVAETLSKYSMCYTGSPKTVDKSAIEGALAGCFVLSENPNVLEQTGMNEVWKIIGQDAPHAISKQINILRNYESRLDLREVIIQNATQKNNLNSTARKMLEILAKND